MLIKICSRAPVRPIFGNILILIIILVVECSVPALGRERDWLVDILGKAEKNAIFVESDCKFEVNVSYSHSGSKSVISS